MSSESYLCQIDYEDLWGQEANLKNENGQKDL